MLGFTQQDADDVRQARNEAYSGTTTYEFLTRLTDLANRLEREANRYTRVLSDKELDQLATDTMQESK